MRKLIRRESLIALAMGVVLGAAGLAAANKYGKPKSVIHVVTVNWKQGTAPGQIEAALNGVEKMAAAYPGIKNVWLRSFKVQGMQQAFVMEFESEDALKKYADSPAQKAWYEVYVPIREESRTHDITN